MLVLQLMSSVISDIYGTYTRLLTWPSDKKHRYYNVHVQFKTLIINKNIYTHLYPYHANIKKIKKIYI